MNPRRRAFRIVLALAPLAAALFAAAEPPPQVPPLVTPPKALDAGTPSQPQIAVNANTQKIATDIPFRKLVADRIQLFLNERGYADPKALAKEKDPKKYWSKISKQVDAALKVYPSSGAVVYEVLGPAEQRQQPERKAKEDQLDSHAL